MTDDYDRYSDDLGIKELRQELRRVKYNNKFCSNTLQYRRNTCGSGSGSNIGRKPVASYFEGDRNIYVTDVTGGTGAYGIKGA